MKSMKKGLTINQKQGLTGWFFLLPATILIFAMNFYPMLQALILSFKTGIGNNQTWGGLSNYARLLQDKVFHTAIINNFFYLIIQVPVMLILAIILATVLNKKDLKCKGLFRTMIFLPCCTALVSYSIIFKTLFAYDGYINTVLLNFGLISERINWLGQVSTAKVIIIIALIWRWTGYNMVFYLAGLQNIDESLYEAARIDGLSELKIFFTIFIPTMKFTYAAAMTVTFMNAWNNYLWPKVIMMSGDSQTMPMLVANLSVGYSIDYGVLMLGVLICSLPTGILFLILQKSFANGIVGAVKG